MKMKRNFAITLVLLFAVICPQLAACAEVKSPYLIQDTGRPAEKSNEVVWLDNHRVRFYGYRDVEIKMGDIHNLPNFIGPGYYIWDINSNQIGIDSTFEGAMRLCVRGDYLTFLRKSPTDGKHPLLVTRDKGQETITPLVNVEWFNRFSCRYYEQRPKWIIPNHQTLPLLDGHGFLDWFPSEGPSSVRNEPIRFRLNNSSEWISLPIGTREVWHNLVKYAPFKNSYLLYPIAYIDPATGKEEPIGPWPKDKPVPVWWLAPDGTITTETLPYMRFMRGGSRAYFPTREGIFITTHKADDLGKPGDAGGYLARNGRVIKLISGLLDSVSISPDGCRVAFIHDPYDTIYGKDRLDRVTLKSINLCQGDRHDR